MNVTVLVHMKLFQKHKVPHFSLCVDTVWYLFFNLGLIFVKVLNSSNLLDPISHSPPRLTTRQWWVFLLPQYKSGILTCCWTPGPAGRWRHWRRSPPRHSCGPRNCSLQHFITTINLSRECLKWRLTLKQWGTACYVKQCMCT